MSLANDATKASSVDNARPPIFRAVEDADAAAVAALLSADAAQARATVESASVGPDTPLHQAAHMGLGDIVALLLEHGADPNARGDGGDTPLHRAANQGHVEVVELLLRHRADVAARSLDGSTPLHGCVPGRDSAFPRTARLLIAHGAAVDLPIALAIGDADSARTLVAAGGPPADDPHRFTLLPGVVSMLTAAIEKEVGGNLSVAPPARLASVSRDVVNRHLDLLDGVLALNPPADRRGASALVEAAQIGDPRVVQRLLAYGVPHPPARSALPMLLRHRVDGSPCRAELEAIFETYGYPW